ncbi:WD40-repeat-containing domain protein [Microdochium trichocladiopsis]|uniref:Probable cytosolic iron-sulfur protein assembly protein 1 n=1 Tax=Microdochium trichocladiopsis TaxID=1682393 RepID=A0A9P9BKG2_9PEZI|nr:WD40-repeat-containing domain protein [Microdochium trichocladiopsis]KAH7021194.1 WD40-repeat-containing domain protein [Microdochium trichocladiopsis]
MADPAALEAAASAEAAKKDTEEARRQYRFWPHVSIGTLPALKPDLQERAWQSIPHPTLPLLATAHQKSVTIFSLSTLSSHSTLTGGHNRSVRSVAWKPNAGAGQLCLVTGSFDSTAGLWRYDNDRRAAGGAGGGRAGAALEREVTAANSGRSKHDDEEDGEEEEEDDWEFTLVLEGHDSEVKSVSFSPAGQYLATCSRDKSVWIWEDVGPGEADDEWETVAVLNEHDGDVKAVAWCPDISGSSSGNRYSSDVLASASYDDTVRIWREDNDGEWVCVAVLEGHKGTVWGLQWEPKPKDGRFPRLMTWSADRTIRLWSLKEESEEEDDVQPAPAAHAWSGALGGIPNTMRRSLKEEWVCTATLPAFHDREIYTASWSASTGRVASSGSDGKIAIYSEGPASFYTGASEKVAPADTETTDAEAAAELDGDVQMGGGGGGSSSKPQKQQDYDHELGSKLWKVVGSKAAAHGPYEVNHITWCKRYDKACDPEKRGVEEMLVTTGDDGTIRPWQVSAPVPELS